MCKAAILLTFAKYAAPAEPSFELIVSIPSAGNYANLSNGWRAALPLRAVRCWNVPGM
jgi:hypothetical protein